MSLKSDGGANAWIGNVGEGVGLPNLYSAISFLSCSSKSSAEFSAGAKTSVEGRRRRTERRSSKAAEAAADLEVVGSMYSKI